MKMRIEPEAAIVMINKTDWEEGDMTMLRELTYAVENGDTLEYEIQ